MIRAYELTVERSSADEQRSIDLLAPSALRNAVLAAAGGRGIAATHAAS